MTDTDGMNPNLVLIDEFQYQPGRPIEIGLVAVPCEDIHTVLDLVSECVEDIGPDETVALDRLAGASGWRQS